MGACVLPLLLLLLRWERGWVRRVLDADQRGLVAGPDASTPAAITARAWSPPATRLTPLPAPSSLPQWRWRRQLRWWLRWWWWRPRRRPRPWWLRRWLPAGRCGLRLSMAFALSLLLLLLLPARVLRVRMCPTRHPACVAVAVAPRLTRPLPPAFPPLSPVAGWLRRPGRLPAGWLRRPGRLLSRALQATKGRPAAVHGAAQRCGLPPLEPRLAVPSAAAAGPARLLLQPSSTRLGAQQKKHSTCEAAANPPPQSTHARTRARVGTPPACRPGRERRHTTATPMRVRPTLPPHSSERTRAPPAPVPAHPRTLCPHSTRRCILTPPEDQH